MRSQDTPITVGVSQHVLVGSLRLAGDRIQERLNDASSDIVTLHDVAVHSHVKRQCVARLPEAVVPKSKIEYLLVSENQHEAPVKRWNNHTKKKVFSAFIVLGDCCISGELHLPSGFADTRYALTHQLSGFFAITDASVRVQGSHELAVPLVFANRDFVSCLHVGEVASASDFASEEPDAVATVV